ncbi:enoyl-CoA hydratase/isomerase family protein [Pandoraea nosoerga]|uniref:Enoyl-CoA hydratase n=1 Tax=Pandoraea nosoerga TaxID=2508296 RepID=A0A5E4TY01_9BURK|nr:enoyl-CoA hydratase [Pandoraea nosoerga]MBN4664968.1 enoyl-CoA hydratase/isomerase family protein [Pandoraea nosoerga]MBN4675316.1 enoyl-CoA hydratase/isomerase family protein [Pandoraea nosoerga]MBN4680711.1 enoyl-CoA hydratase/isomerase family protein [Pandoraea nosoerga]MBN4745897.1 enoyl-CoA hydratase/isomerase family protein [Pandoraea nosoerga]VVD90749.1 enoyl-CoA hydratase [Pandoraea nosoerga]
MSAELLAERVDHTLVLTLSNPGARNALHPDMYAAGVEALATAERDPSVRAVVLTGADNFFCAGGNLNRLLENRKQDPSVQAASIDALAEWIEALRACPKPVIAAVEGAAAGAGFSLALACDLLVAAENAKFVMAYVKVGLTPDGGGSWFLSQALPRALATEILLEGKPVAATRLAAAGVVNRVVAPGQARAEALNWATDLAQLSPNAVGRIKSLIESGASATLTEQLGAERDNFVASLHHADGLEGISAFLEKRPAKYI